MIQDVNSAFSCTVMFVSISEVIGCEDRLRNDLYCVEWGVKLYSNQSNQIGIFARSVRVKLLLSCCAVEWRIVPPWAVVASPTLLPSLVLYISRYFWISKEVYETFRNRIVPYCNPGQTGCHRATLCGGRAVWPICLQIYWTCQISIFSTVLSHRESNSNRRRDTTKQFCRVGSGLGACEWGMNWHWPVPCQKRYASYRQKFNSRNSSKCPDVWIKTRHRLFNTEDRWVIHRWNESK